MTIWKLEWLRIVRTRRWLILAGIFVLSGLATPVLIHYLPQILAAELEGYMPPPPTPAAAVAEFGGTLTGLGLIVVVAVAAAGLSVDANPPLAAFYRTRASLPAILLPRVVVCAACTTVALTLGAAAAWYETTVLIGQPALPALLAGTALGSLYLLFAIAVVALATSLVRSAVAAVGITLGLLLLLPVVAVYEPFRRWLPSHLAGSISGLAHGTPAAEYTQAAIATALLIVAFLSVAAWRLGRREL